MDERTLAEILSEEIVELVIDDYGFQGEGFARVADGWISVHGALPGELVRVQVEGRVRRGQRAYATLLDVLKPADFRRDPLCKRDAYCRGCHLRPMTIDEELRFHVRTVQEVVAKFGGIAQEDQPPCEIITPQPISRGDSFRIRSALTYRRADSPADDHPASLAGAPPAFQLGLTTPVRDALVPMFDCPALTTPVRRLITSLELALASLDELPWDAAMARRARQGEAIDTRYTHPRPPAIDTIHVASPVIGRGWVDVHLFESASPNQLTRAVAEGALKRLFERLARDLPDEVGLAVSHKQQRVILKAPERLVIPLAGLRLEVGYDDWFPTTLAPSEALYARVMDLLALTPAEDFLDIGCGIGTIALLAARRAGRVVGLDINRRSIATAQLNAMANHRLAGRAEPEFIVGSWENALRRLVLEGRRFHTATINPMREPLGRRALSYLRRLGVERLVYLGPSPASAARDIAELRDMGWALDTLAAANIHPATYHTMLVARLVRMPGE